METTTTTTQTTQTAGLTGTSVTGDAAGGPIPPTVWPCVNCADAPAQIRFLRDAFGFEERLVVTGDDGLVHHFELVWPEGGGVMGGSAGKEGPFGSLPTGVSSNYVVTAEPDPILARATAAGAEVVSPMREEDYGSRGFTVRDPEGNLWSFGTYRGA